MREMIELAQKLEECKEEMHGLGGYGAWLDDIPRYGTDICVMIHRDDFPQESEIHYDTSIYIDKVVKYTTIGKVRFIALLNLEDAIAENETLAFDYYGALI